MDHKSKNIIYTCIIVPVAVTNGIISGVSSVIAAYFFKPLWNTITELWGKNDS
jgi:hypothetical protein